VNAIAKRYKTVIYRKIRFAKLDLALKRIYRNKSELLLVLQRPDIPLHNNLSERDIREYVKRRKMNTTSLLVVFIHGCIPFIPILSV
jgi:hypothetical protein